MFLHHGKASSRSRLDGARHAGIWRAVSGGGNGWIRFEAHSCARTVRSPRSQPPQRIEPRSRRGLGASSGRTKCEITRVLWASREQRGSASLCSSNCAASANARASSASRPPSSPLPTRSKDFSFELSGSACFNVNEGALGIVGRACDRPADKLSERAATSQNSIGMTPIAITSLGTTSGLKKQNRPSSIPTLSFSISKSSAERYGQRRLA